MNPQVCKMEQCCSVRTRSENRKKAFVYCKQKYVFFFEIWLLYLSISGHAVAQLIEALRYKLEGRGVDSR
jgi:hypothetical protein